MNTTTEYSIVPGPHLYRNESALVTLAGQTVEALSRLRETCKTLPGRLYALHNEVEDLKAVLRDVEQLSQDRSRHVALEQPNGIAQLLTQATVKLNDLKSFVDGLDKACKHTNIPLVKARAWQKTQGKLQRLQEDLKTIKGDLNISLGSSNSRDLVRVRLDLESITTTATQIADAQSELREEHREGLAHQKLLTIESTERLYIRMDQRIGQVEALIRSQAEQMDASQSDRLAGIYEPPPAYRRRKLSHTSSTSSTGLKRPSPEPQKQPGTDEAIGVRVTQHASLCTAKCHCACHKQGKTATPQIMNRVLGQMFIGYAGMPLLSPKCDSPSCEKAQSPNVSLEYWFPIGFFWSQIVRLQLAYQPKFGPQAALSTLRQIPDSSPSVDFALGGNINGLKDLFKNGMASPRDISSTRGYSLLRWALYGKQYETVKFLTYAGADPDYRPLSNHDNSPRNKAHDFVLQGGLSEDAFENLRCLTSGSDWEDEQNFTIIHKVVLGFSGKSLEDVILQHPDDIDTQDAMGRTPLLWAAARGDERAVMMLLAYGADTNLMDMQLAGPVSYAADQDHATCVRLLLEAGADPDPEIPGGFKVGSPLNCAARNATDPMVLKNLLDFNADIEASNVDGKTPLIHVARTGNVKFALLLLEYGADINAVSSTEQTPLTTAITYNNHDILQLLLDRWFEYSECPRLKGPHLLSIVATYADLKTVNILATTDHLKLKYDKDYSTTGFESLIKERFSSNEKLVVAFDNLLHIINLEPNWKVSNESLMESGMLSRRSTGTESSCPSHTSATHQNSDSDEEFENALEFLTVDDKLSNTKIER
ncbi:MAG: hypothetical protein M1820_008044 [Bogoriella megaspora]|nr:MAG: hypothetical protein M1820_008044 [Bogoriella megaspora]